MSLVEMSKRLRIPISTLFETLKEVEKIFDFTIALKGNDKNAHKSSIDPRSQKIIPTEQHPQDRGHVLLSLPRPESPLPGPNLRKIVVEKL